MNQHKHTFHEKIKAYIPRKKKLNENQINHYPSYIRDFQTSIDSPLNTSGQGKLQHEHSLKYKKISEEQTFSTSNMPLELPHSPQGISNL